VSPSAKFRKPNKGSSHQNVFRFIGILLLGLQAVLLGPDGAATQWFRWHANREARHRELRFWPGIWFARFAGLPGLRLQLSFDLNPGAGCNELADNFRKSLPGHNAVPFDTLLPLAAAVLESLVRGKAKLDALPPRRYSSITENLATRDSALCSINSRPVEMRGYVHRLWAW